LPLLIIDTPLFISHITPLLTLADIITPLAAIFAIIDILLLTLMMPHYY
jgi:hypothetical protein